MNKDLIDADGENRAVRAFLAQYGSNHVGVSVGAMILHMERSGYPFYPEWAPHQWEEHLTKAGAQQWLRHLFALEGQTEYVCVGQLHSMPGTAGGFSMIALRGQQYPAGTDVYVLKSGE